MSSSATAADDNPGYKLELYPTERRYSVAGFDHNCTLDFSGKRGLRMALQEAGEDGEEESEEVRKQLAEIAARPKRFRAKERAPLAKKWVVSDGATAYEGTVLPVSGHSAPAAYVLLVPNGPTTFHVVPVADRVQFRKPGPQGLTMAAADERLEQRAARQRKDMLRLGRGRAGKSGGGGGGGGGADEEDNPFALPVKSRRGGGGGSSSRARLAEKREDLRADFGEDEMARSDDEELGTGMDLEGGGGEDGVPAEDDGDMDGFGEDADNPRVLSAGGADGGAAGGGGGGPLTYAELDRLRLRKERDERRKKAEWLDADAFSGEFSAANDALLAQDLASERAAAAAAAGGAAAAATDGAAAGGSGTAAAAAAAAAAAGGAAGGGSKKRAREEDGEGGGGGGLPRTKISRQVSGIDLALETGAFTQDTVISELKRFGGSMTIKNLLRRMKPLLKQKKARIELQEIIRLVGHMDDDPIEGKVMRLKQKFA